jgi:hypothetical protein
MGHTFRCQRIADGKAGQLSSVCSWCDLFGTAVQLGNPGDSAMLAAPVGSAHRKLAFLDGEVGRIFETCNRCEAARLCRPINVALFLC